MTVLSPNSPPTDPTADPRVSEERCARCHRPSQICVCDRVTRLECHRRILLLQHPQEADVDLGTAALLADALPDVQIAAGLSWPTLAAALGAEPGSVSSWAVIFPDNKLKPADGIERAGVHFALRDRRGATVTPGRLRGLVALDGSWSQAKTLWWRNPWLLKLNRLTLFPTEPGIYGKLRREPRAQYISTLEAIADTLAGCGEPPATRTELRRLLRTMVQRARDARQGGGKPSPR